MVSIQSAYMSPFKCRCYSPSGNLVSCSLLTFCLSSLNYLLCGNVIYGTSIVCVATYTIVGITNGATLPLIIFCAFVFLLSYSLLTPKLEAPPSLALFFFLRTLFGYSVVAFFLFSNVVCMFSLILFTLADGFYRFSFWWTNRYSKIFANINANWHVSLLIPLILLDIIIPPI